jgi:hypothetical protein
MEFKDMGAAARFELQQHMIELAVQRRSMIDNFEYPIPFHNFAAMMHLAWCYSFPSAPLALEKLHSELSNLCDFYPKAITLFTHDDGDCSVIDVDMEMIEALLVERGGSYAGRNAHRTLNVNGEQEAYMPASAAETAAWSDTSLPMGRRSITPTDSGRPSSSLSGCSSNSAGDREDAAVMDLCRWLSLPLAVQLEQSGVKYEIDMSKLDGKVKAPVEKLKAAFLCCQADACGVESSASCLVVDILSLIFQRLVSVEFMPWDDLLDYADCGDKDAQVRLILMVTRSYGSWLICICLFCLFFTSLISAGSCASLQNGWTARPDPVDRLSRPLARLGDEKRLRPVAANVPTQMRLGEITSLRPS